MIECYKIRFYNWVRIMNTASNFTNNKISIIGLGYVGLPLAIAFSKTMNVVGFDISTTRINELKNGFDNKNESSKEELLHPNLSFTNVSNDLLGSDCYIITVPTPIDNNFNPDLTNLLDASKLVGESLKASFKKNNSATIPLIIYESTVFPGCTEEECIPIIDKESGLENGKDFKVGYSPKKSYLWPRP